MAFARALVDGVIKFFTESFEISGQMAVVRITSHWDERIGLSLDRHLKVVSVGFLSTVLVHSILRWSDHCSVEFEVGFGHGLIWIWAIELIASAWHWKNTV